MVSGRVILREQCRAAETQPRMANGRWRNGGDMAMLMNPATVTVRQSRRECGCHIPGWMVIAALLVLAAPVRGQTLINVDFGVGTASRKIGLAATGMGTNDYWNLYRHYDPKFTPGIAMVANGKLDKLRLADGTETGVSVAVNNAPGVWGNSSGDPMYDTYIFA